MPQRISCDKCKQVLYEDSELKRPDEILTRYDGRCPNCHKKLAIHPLKIEVSAAE